MDFEIITPKTRHELLNAMQWNKSFRFGAGYTDLILELKKQSGNSSTIINLAQLKEKEFNAIEKKSSALKIGALVTASKIIGSDFISKNFLVLYNAANNLASPQIRQVATIGGNLCIASPSGDMSCALVALKAKCEILSANGKTREIPITEFFTGPRETTLKKNEVLRNVIIPLNEKGKNIHSGFIKVGTRRSMECSVVSLAYHILTDKKGVITQAGVAIGSVAPTIQFTEEACYFLKGKNIFSMSENEREMFAQVVLQYASPISDIRASAWYRKEVLFNISKSIFEN